MAGHRAIDYKFLNYEGQDVHTDASRGIRPLTWSGVDYKNQALAALYQYYLQADNPFVLPSVDQGQHAAEMKRQAIDIGFVQIGDEKIRMEDLGRHIVFGHPQLGGESDTVWVLNHLYKRNEETLGDDLRDLAEMFPGRCVDPGTLSFEPLPVDGLSPDFTEASDAFPCHGRVDGRRCPPGVDSTDLTAA